MVFAERQAIGHRQVIKKRLPGCQIVEFFLGQQDGRQIRRKDIELPNCRAVGQEEWYADKRQVGGLSYRYYEQ
jgi:hypothetical protein